MSDVLAGIGGGRSADTGRFSSVIRVAPSLFRNGRSLDGACLRAQASLDARRVLVVRMVKVGRLASEDDGELESVGACCRTSVPLHRTTRATRLRGCPRSPMAGREGLKDDPPEAVPRPSFPARSEAALRDLARREAPELPAKLREAPLNCALLEIIALIRVVGGEAQATKRLGVGFGSSLSSRLGCHRYSRHYEWRLRAI